jgi:glycosyltransferase involved in cell wall biosynthesis
VFALTCPRALLGAIERLHRERPALARLLRVRVVGRVDETEQESLDRMASLGVECTGYVDKDRAVAELAASHMVVCLLADVAGAERIYPGKRFELMYLGRPCLTIAPPGSLRDLVDRHRFGAAYDPGDEAGIAGALERALLRFRDGAYDAAETPMDIERYHRRSTAGELATVFRDAMTAAGGGGRM